MTIMQSIARFFGLSDPSAVHFPLERSTVEESTAERSTKAHESLTDWENKYIADAVRKHNQARCPDCGGRLLKGPQGGMSMNAACKQCGSEFNIMLFGIGKSGQCVGERISDPGPRDVAERAGLYGMKAGETG